MRWDLVIFDCDGVLVDSEVIACRAVSEALVEFGYNLPVDEIAERFIGTSTDNGGVHFNNAIGNHAYYLVVNGGSNAGEAHGHPHTGPVVTGIGVVSASRRP